jgi:hypothetical protein
MLVAPPQLSTDYLLQVVVEGLDIILLLHTMRQLLGDQVAVVHMLTMQVRLEQQGKATLAEQVTTQAATDILVAVAVVLVVLAQAMPPTLVAMAELGFFIQ